MRADKLYLVGFMAAGKSSVARETARRLDWRVEDVDERIEAKEGLSVAQIFALRGEAHFRSVERAVLLDLLVPRHLVVATGGGTFADPLNRAAMRNDGAVIWIDVPLAELVGRIPMDGSRPLASTRLQLEQLYTQRRDAYAHAHVRLDGSRQSVGQLVDALMAWMSP
ncbi:MAG: shikimate kinase [Acidobacteriota bacterium]